MTTKLKLTRRGEIVLTVLLTLAVIAASAYLLVLTNLIEAAAYAIAIPLIAVVWAAWLALILIEKHARNKAQMSSRVVSDAHDVLKARLAAEDMMTAHYEKSRKGTN